MMPPRNADLLRIVDASAAQKLSRILRPSSSEKPLRSAMQLASSSPGCTWPSRYMLSSFSDTAGGSCPSMGAAGAAAAPPYAGASGAPAASGAAGAGSGAGASAPAACSPASFDSFAGSSSGAGAASAFASSVASAGSAASAASAAPPSPSVAGSCSAGASASGAAGSSFGSSGSLAASVLDFFVFGSTGSTGSAAASSAASLLAARLRVVLGMAPFSTWAPVAAAADEQTAAEPLPRHALRSSLPCTFALLNCVGTAGTASFGQNLRYPLLLLARRSGAARRARRANGGAALAPSGLILNYRFPYF